LTEEQRGEEGEGKKREEERRREKKKRTLRSLRPVLLFVCTF